MAAFRQIGFFKNKIKVKMYLYKDRLNDLCFACFIKYAGLKPV